MIRSASHADIDAIVSIWLKTSVKAHDFVPSEYWNSKVGDMRGIYLPSSENFVYESDHEIIGFISIYENNIAALFVSPQNQGRGIGSKLINFAKDKYKNLNLSVYKENHASVSFYKRHGFVSVREQIDPNTKHPEIVMRLSP